METAQVPDTATPALKRKRRERIPLRITDTTLRDAHQSLWATRMRMDDIQGIIDTIDSVGYYSLEVWGGATFDACLRFLRENPWDRLRQIKARAKKTPLQMLLRGQNILGYRNYPDDLVDRFVALACQNGIDIFRVFDALNDNRNLEHAIRAIKANGGHAQGTLCYTTSPVHTVQEYVRVAREQVHMGIDSLCIKDMAGILSPIAAEELVSALMKAVRVPIQLHCHATSGMATSAYVEGVRAGAGAIDCAISSMAGFSSQPPVETMLAIFAEMPYHANLDMDALRKISKYFMDLGPRRRPTSAQECIIDPEILIHHIPGGMISNLRSQLQQQNALDRLNDVLAELPRVRADLGFPPLVTPTSQIVGVQAVMNVLAGERYTMVPQEIKDYVKGLYGRSPAPVNPEVRQKILGNEATISCRPADLLEPILPKVTLDVDPQLIKTEEDIISYCLFPEPALEYFKWRNTPEKERQPAPVEQEQRQEAQRPATTPAAVTPFLSPDDYRELHLLVQKIHTMGITEITVRKGTQGLSLEAPGSQGRVQTHTVTGSTTTPVGGPSAAPASAAGAPPPAGPTINSPLNGTFYLSPGPGQPPFAKEGDTLKAGMPVCIVEAMKLFNQIKTPYDCRIVKMLVEHGKPVQKDQPLVAVEKL